MTPEPTFTSFWLPLMLPVLLTLTVYRLTRLVVRDTFPPVLWLRDRLAGGWRDLTSEERRMLFGGVLPGDKRMELRKVWSVNPEGTQRYIYRWRYSPYWLAELMTCPWCASGWITGAVIAATDVAYGLPVPWLTGLSVWGAAALLASQEWA